MNRCVVVLVLVLACSDGAPTNERPCGMSLAESWTQGGSRGYGTADSARALDALAAMGMTAIAVSPFGFVEHVDDATVSWPRSEHIGDALRTVIDQAHARRFEVMLKPQIYPLDGQWCGDIAPKDGWDAWFASYSAFTMVQARLAEETHSEWFVVGHEMSRATLTETDAWVRLIAQVRAVYHGKIVYAANWDEADHVQFWPRVDVVGIQMYAPLREPGGPKDRASLRAGADRWLRKFEAIAKAAGKPLMITEAGFVNRVDVTWQPHVWPEWLTDEWPSLEGDAEQAAGYRALIDTFGSSPSVTRIFWWKWFTDMDGWLDEGPLGFTPKGRAAEAVLRQMCAKAVR